MHRLHVWVIHIAKNNTKLEFVLKIVIFDKLWVTAAVQWLEFVRNIDV